MEELLKKFKQSVNDTGALTVIEAQKDVPFEIKRVYYIYNVEQDARRGFHAHKKLEQYLICVNGSCKVDIDDGSEKSTVCLDNPNEGIYVGPKMWHEMYDFTDEAVLLVLASDYYDEADYIRNYGDFLQFIGME